ncbi:MAG TPA: S1C family serine protease [Kofleriaceae bacterium]|jgi:general secretion pathway protein C|nr:S1C family serine protease [Kofleriaceae bacterium]
MRGFARLSLWRWSVGLARRPWLVTAFTVGVCAGFAARAAAALVEASYLEDAPGPMLGPAPRPRPPAWPPRPDGSQLVDRNMFCSQCGPGGPDPGAGAMAQAILIATSLGRDPLATLAIPTTAVQGAWGLGEAVPGLGRLDRIGATWAEIIDGAGHRGRLSLHEAAAGRVPDTAMPGTAPAAWDARIRQVDDQTYEVDRSLVRELVTGAIRPGSVRMIPQFDHAALTGIRLLGATAGSVPAAIGLASGDIVSAINGAPIQNVQQLLDLYAGLDQLTTVELSGTRRGQPLTRTLRLR